MPISKIDEDDLIEFLCEDLAALSADVRQKLRQLIVRIFEYAHEKGYVRDESAAADLPNFISGAHGKARSQEDFLTEQEFAQFVASIPKARARQKNQRLGRESVPGVRLPEYYRVHILTLYYTGCRISELAGITRDQCVLSEEPGRSYLRIETTLYQGYEGRQLIRPKTNAGFRTIYIPDRLADELRHHLEHQFDHANAAAKQWERRHGRPAPALQDMNLVFTSPYGRPLNVNNFRRRIFRRFAEVSGLKKRIHPHTLRHSFLTLLASSVDGNPAVFASYAGHSDLRSSERYLGTPEERKMAASWALHQKISQSGLWNSLDGDSSETPGASA